MWIVAEQQVEILERLGKIERLHLVDVFGNQHVRHRRIALVKARVLLKCREDLPTPVTIAGVTSQPIHVEQALDGLRAVDVVALVELCNRQTDRQTLTLALSIHVEQIHGKKGN